MRRTLTLCRTGLAGVAAVVLLTACSGNDDTSASSSSAAESTSASSAESSASGGASGNAGDSEFCTQAFDAFGQLSSVSTSNDPAVVVPALQQLTTSLDAIDAPAEISGDWQTLVDALQQLVDTAGSLDLSTPEGLQQFQQAEAQLTAQVGDAQTNVSNYVTQNCPQASTTTAPAS
jgi:hypothetical protein